VAAAGDGQLVARYDQPWGAPVVSETFKDRDYTRNPGWDVKSGEFWVDASLGLRSQALAAPASSPAAASQDESVNWGSVLMGVLLRNQMQSSGTSAQADAKKYAPAVITLPVSVGNAFALDVAFSQHKPTSETSRIEFGMVDGSSSA
jgi:hypothetical protein